MNAKTILPPGWAVPEVFTARLGESVGRQRAMFADGQLLLVLHGPPDPDNDLERQGRLFWRQRGGAWKASESGAGVATLRAHLAEFVARQEDLDERLQTAAAAEDYFQILQEAVPLQRTSRNLHKVLQEARELVPEDRDLITLRDRAGDIERAMELLHSDARNGMDFTVARQAEQQAKSSYAMGVSAHRLNMMAALFLPLATVSSVLGMNVPHGLETSVAPENFFITIGAAVLAGILLAILVSSRAARPYQPTAQNRTKRKLAAKKTSARHAKK